MAAEEELLHGISLMKEGKEEGFNILYSHTYNYVYSRARSVMKTESDAQDLTQETFIQAYKGIASLEDANNVYAWLGGIVFRQGAKLYNKTKELQAGGNKKPWIVWKWYLCGLIDNPVTMMKKSANGGEYSPTIWRLEFSLRSQADNWIVIENQAGKKVKRQAIPHKLSLFDSPDKLWQRFQELSFHYFRFKKMEEGKRKDRCKDKVLFYWDRQVEFMQVSMLPREAKPNQDDEILRRKLQTFKEHHFDNKIRVACEVILDELYKNKALQVAPREKVQEVLALRLATRLKFQMPEADFAVLLQEATNLVKEGEIW